MFCVSNSGFVHARKTFYQCTSKSACTHTHIHTHIHLFKLRDKMFKDIVLGVVFSGEQLTFLVCSRELYFFLTPFTLVSEPWGFSEEICELEWKASGENWAFLFLDKLIHWSHVLICILHCFSIPHHCFLLNINSPCVLFFVFIYVHAWVYLFVCMWCLCYVCVCACVCMCMLACM